MTIRMRFFVTILLFMLCVGCFFCAMYVSAKDNKTIDTKLTLSGFSSGATRTHNNGVDYVTISNKGFYATMHLNEVYVDGEENWSGGVRFRPTSGAIKLNGNNTNGVSIKIRRNKLLCRMVYAVGRRCVAIWRSFLQRR